MGQSSATAENSTATHIRIRQLLARTRIAPSLPPKPNNSLNFYWNSGGNSTWPTSVIAGRGPHTRISS